MSDAMLRTGAIDAVAIDSLAMLVPSEEIEKSTVDWQQGLQARLINKAIRKWNGALNFCGKKFGRRPTLILINQLRMKIGIHFGNPEVKPGGRGQDYVTSVDIKLWNGKTEVDDKSNRPLLATKKFKVDKNKVYKSHMSGEFTLVLDNIENKKLGDLMEEEFVYNEMDNLGLLQHEKKGGRIVLIDKQRLNGKGQVLKYWIENPKSFDKAKKLLMEAF